MNAFWLAVWAPQALEHGALILASLVCASVMAPKFLSKEDNMEHMHAKYVRTGFDVYLAE